MSEAKGTTSSAMLGAKVLEDVNRCLRQIAAGLGFIVLQMSPLKESNNREKIRFLSKFGFDRNQIAAILDSTPNSVSTELSILKGPRGKEEAPTEKTNG